MSPSDWVTLVAAVTAAGASLYAASRSRGVQLSLATRALEQERDLQLRPKRAELYSRLVRDLRGVGRVDPPSTSLDDDARATVREMFAGLSKSAQSRYFSASEVLAEMRVHASQTVREAAEGAVQALNVLSFKWLLVLFEDAQGHTDRVSALLQGDLQSAQDQLTRAAIAFEAEVQTELGGGQAATDSEAREWFRRIIRSKRRPPDR